MKCARWLFLFLCFAAAASCQTSGKLYPGAKLDPAATSEAKLAAASQPDIDISVYTTADSFEKVCDFFRKSGKEYKPIGARARKLPTGQELKDTLFILDNAADLMTTRKWVKVQRPYIGQYGLARGAQNASSIRDVTAIVLTAKK